MTWVATGLLALFFFPLVTQNFLNVAATQKWDQVLSDHWTAIMAELAVLATNPWYLVILGIFIGSVATLWLLELLPKAKTTHIANIDSHDLTGTNPTSDLKLVSRGKFSNETVLLDGHRYINCIFDSVTFEYNGGDFVLDNCEFSLPTIQISSRNRQIGEAIRFFSTLMGIVKSDETDGTGKRHLTMIPIKVVSRPAASAGPQLLPGTALEKQS
jgi:hypothetical protein